VKASLLLLPTLLAAALFVGWRLPFEDRFVYFPTREIALTPANYGLRYEEVALVAADGVRLASWALLVDNGSESAPWLIYFHGNGENVSRYLPFTRHLVAMGLNVLMLSYRGYGASEGTPSEAGLYRDAEAAYAHLLERGVNPSRIALYGFSLGTGVATYLAANAEVAALVLEAPFTSVPDVARHLYRIVPTRLLRNRFDSASRIRKVDAPLLVLHARDDRMVPFALGKELYALAAEPKALVELSGDHLAMLEGGQDEALAVLERFFRRYLKDKETEAE
jgi:fermentation-respiration switch protein FrsA (DUF1100 family)